MSARDGSRWSILHETKSNRRGVFVFARCSCGTEREVLRSSILRGDSRSCGCLHRELVAERLTTHGLSKRPEYHLWEAMVQRCTNPNDRKWEHYGGRGISVCERWRYFPNFFADMGERPDGLTLDRIDVDGNYEPGNLRWATYSEQNMNRRLAASCRNGHRLTAATASRGVVAPSARPMLKHATKLIAGPPSASSAKASRMCNHMLGPLPCLNPEPHKGGDAGRGCTHAASSAPDRHTDEVCDD